MWKSIPLTAILLVFSSNVLGAKTCVDALRKDQGQLSALPRNLSLVAGPRSFASVFEFSDSLERENQNRLFDSRRALFYYENFTKRLAPKAIDAIAIYKGAGYAGMNRILRNPLPGDQDLPEYQLVNIFDRCIDIAPSVPQGIVLFRGIKLSRPENVVRPDNSIIQDKAFVSTSLSASIAANFALGAFGSVQKGDKGTSILQVIHVNRSDIRGLYIEGKAMMGGESEIVLDRGTRFRVVKSEWVEVGNEFPDFSGFVGGPPLPPSKVLLENGVPLPKDPLLGSVTLKSDGFGNDVFDSAQLEFDFPSADQPNPDPKSGWDPWSSNGGDLPPLAPNRVLIQVLEPLPSE